MNFHTSWFQENIQTLSAFVLVRQGMSVVKINVNLWNKVRDASKRGKHSSKLVPKSIHAAQDAILKQT